MIKRIIKGILSIVCMLSCYVYTPKIVQASSEYPMNCSTFEVDTVNDQGGFTLIGCYNDFITAKNVMKNSGVDAVIRHGRSESPTSIIAMNSGIAISYPARSNSSTLTITQFETNVANQKTTYVTKHRELGYFDTTSYYGDGNGKIEIMLTGFRGFVDLNNVDLVPTKIMERNQAILLGGNDRTGANEYPFWVRVYQSHYTVVQNGAYKDLVFKAYSGWANSTTYPAEYTMVVGLAADWMKVNDVYYSFDGYNFYSDRRCLNKVNTYYNYYQFLSLRTKSKIPVSAYNQLLINKQKEYGKLFNQGSVFLEGQELYGSNAAIVFAMACLESAYGTSNYAMTRNNLFGWNAYDSNPDSASYFPTVRQGILEHMGINLRGYSDIYDARYFGSHVGNKGSGFNVKYASDPYWGYKIAAIAYELDKIANNFNGNLYDTHQTSMGYIPNYKTTVYTSIGGAPLFTTEYGSTYQNNMMVTVLSKEGAWYKISIPNGKRLDGSLIRHRNDGIVAPFENYLWNNSVGYVKENELQLVNKILPAQIVGNYPTGNFVLTISKLAFENNNLVIQGEGYRPGIFVTDTNKISHTVQLVDQYFKETSFNATTTKVTNDKCTFAVSPIDLSKLLLGDYSINIKTSYSSLSQFNDTSIITDAALSTLPIEFELNNRLYTFKFVNKTLVFSVKEKPAAYIPIIHNSSSSLTNSIWTIEGKAQINNEQQLSQTTHRIVLKNKETQEMIPFNATTSKDTMDNTYSLYHCIIDLSSVANGNYEAWIEINNGSMSRRQIIYCDSTFMDKTSTTEDTVYRLFRHYLGNNQLAISKEKSQLDFNLIHKNSVRNSFFGYSTMKVNENVVHIDGYAFMHAVSTTSNDNVSTSIVLVGSDGQTYVYPTVIKACSADFAAMRNETPGYYSNSCFDVQLDTSSLPVGVYDMYVDTSTSNYRDIFEMVDIREQCNVMGSSNNRNIVVRYSPIRSRLQITISPQ